MMTLEETIEHCKEVAKESREAALSYARESAYETAISCKAVGYAHAQIAEWLIELKQRREAKNRKKPKTNGNRIRQMTDEELAEFFDKISDCQTCIDNPSKCHMECIDSRLQWLKQEVSEDD